MTPHPAAARQILAADPAASTWLSANAGSGKTRVLTDRVSRLLIEGTEPQRILCLTYTKAAAAEMQNRLFDQLGKWAMLGDGDLHAALEGLGVEVGASAAGSERLAEARRLFARAIETPGGLRIQTIHAFCAGLLRRFPLEAGVSPLFAEADDRAMDLLRAEIVEAMASGPEAALVDALAMDLTAQDFGAITHQIARHRGRFAEGLDLAAALRHLGVAPDLTEARVLATAFCGDEAAMLRAAVAAMAEGSTNDRKAAAALGAEGVGVRYPEARLDDAVAVIERLRLPSGAYVYGTYALFRPAAGFNMVQGSLARSQPCNLALHLFGDRVSLAEVEAGLDAMRREHRYLQIGQGRPRPHEAYYQNSGYYYLYGHWYAAENAALLKSPASGEYAQWLEEVFAGIQNPDGSWLDFPL
ncbi:MAG: UvrD-helicase domain-containing protein, partial [Gemmobacter sp.]